MKTATISRGGQLSVPAEIRHRWGVTRVVIEDRGDALIVRPLPEDPIAAARGSLRASGMSAEKARARSRRDEAAAERQRGAR
jgi:bifunctional DNA-binding transcriptional regulator/antitoxin component of YhaV-PrlF toxin-antitoxin module